MMNQRERRQRHSTRITFPGILFILTIAAALNLHSTQSYVNAAPYMLLMNSVPKCVTVEGPRETTFGVSYKFPDFGENDERMKPSIIVSQQTPPITSQRKNYAANTVRPYTAKHDITGTEGAMRYTTRDDCRVRICARAVTASPRAPKRMYLYVDLIDDEKEAQKEAEKKRASQDEITKQKKENSAIQRNLNSVEGQMRSMIQKADSILKTADYAKEQEMAFHDQTVALTRSSIWWPVVQLIVLLVMGFTQANHIVKFFKRHHI
uniref:GOLD domain-containing protein n=1 Tax=Ditylum brightwellii TaxID=49249 RepID=A0A6U3Z905_9STRA|mmetsp:Transcript_28112/g.41830  ORF Transcript_28112/g.41830 Transcript_28112/m.41830 type:complete len:264 (+) Transcript_28112:47-838(+)